jgi:hypothetical protein
LNGLLAHLGKVAGFIDHAAALATHSERARLARILGSQPAVEREGSDIAALGKNVLHRSKATGCIDSGECHMKRLEELDALRLITGRQEVR